MILVLGHVARVHPTANSPLCSLQARILGAHPPSVLPAIQDLKNSEDELPLCRQQIS